MPGETADVVMFGPKPIIEEALSKAPGLRLHRVWAAPDPEAFSAEIAPTVRGIAAAGGHGRIDGAMMARFPRLEIVSSFGVGYDHIDAKWAGEHGITVTNTPDVLNEEVADTALGLLLCTVRQLPQAERYLRAGKWPAQGDYQLTPSLRDRTAGIVGMGRIGKAIARRLDAMRVPVVYHTRRPVADVPYRHYPNLVEMARDVDLMIVITPGGAATRNLVDAAVLEALGPNGILINVARGSVVDEAALIDALKTGKILSAGLDVFVAEPKVPQELIAMDNVVLLPHVGSASQATRRAMDQLVADNIISWFAGKGPLTPVSETPVKKTKSPAAAEPVVMSAMTIRRLLAIGATLALSGVALAQSPAPGPALPEPSEAARALVGAWELSNPDRDRRCTLTFKLDPAPPGRSVTMSSACPAAFPDLRAVAAWQMARDDSLRLVDAAGALLLELNEVESGMYETTPSHTHYFLQTLAATGKERITDDLFGDWQFSRSGKVICQITLANTAYDSNSFALTLKPGCDPLIARFSPVAWRFDRGQLVMLAANGQNWRFEETEDSIWSRIPAMRPPLTMARPAAAAQ